MGIVKRTIICTLGLLIVVVGVSSRLHSHHKHNHGIKSHGEFCIENKVCNYTAHLRCLEQKCQCRSEFRQGILGDYKLRMQWNAEGNVCFSVLNSICTGTTESSVPEGKIHAECLPGLVCMQEYDLDMGIGTCQLHLQNPNLQTPTTATPPVLDEVEGSSDLEDIRRKNEIQSVSCLQNFSQPNSKPILANSVSSSSMSKNISDLHSFFSLTLVLFIYSINQ